MPTFECPTCEKQLTVVVKEDAPHRPFCSKRCKMIDLGRWFDGSYQISEPLSPDEFDELSSEQADD